MTTIKNNNGVITASLNEEQLQKIIEALLNQEPIVDPQLVPVFDYFCFSKMLTDNDLESLAKVRKAVENDATLSLVCDLVLGKPLLTETNPAKHLEVKEITNTPEPVKQTTPPAPEVKKRGRGRPPKAVKPVVQDVKAQDQTQVS